LKFEGLMRATSLSFSRNVISAIVGGVLALQPGSVSRVAAQATAARAPLDSWGDFRGLVDIGGGRRIYLKCRGTGGPTVVLEAGYRSSA
jgi:hypothetical protein